MNGMKKEIEKKFADHVFLYVDGFDNCLLGIEESSKRLIYSTKKILETIIKNSQEFEKMSKLDAFNYFNFNFKISCINYNHNPIFIYDLDDDWW